MGDRMMTPTQPIAARTSSLVIAAWIAAAAPMTMERTARIWPQWATRRSIMIRIYLDPRKLQSAVLRSVVRGCFQCEN